LISSILASIFSLLASAFFWLASILVSILVSKFCVIM
jgi:hypothetical protein